MTSPPPQSSPCPHPRWLKRADGFACAECGHLADLDGITSAPLPDVPAEPLLPLLPPGGLLPIVVGLVLAAWIVANNSLPSFIIRMLGTLAHETGHAFTAIVLGHPALPSFDLIHGGGVTAVQEQSLVLIAFEAGLLGIFVYLHRRNPWAWGAAGVLATTLLMLGLSDYGDLLILSMGHGGQVLMGAIFLYRAWAGVAVAHVAERWLYALIGWVLLLHAGGMCWDLIHDAEALESYLIGKCGMDNDLVRITEALPGVSLDAVVWFHFFMPMVAPAVVWAAYRYRASVRWLLRRIVAAE